MTGFPFYPYKALCLRCRGKAFLYKAKVLPRVSERRRGDTKSYLPNRLSDTPVSADTLLDPSRSLAKVRRV